MVSIDELKGYPETADMVLLKRSRLSVQPVRLAEYDFVVDLARRPRPDDGQRSA